MALAVDSGTTLITYSAILVSIQLLCFVG